MCACVCVCMCVRVGSEGLIFYACMYVCSFCAVFYKGGGMRGVKSNMCHFPVILGYKRDFKNIRAWYQRYQL